MAGAILNIAVILLVGEPLARRLRGANLNPCTNMAWLASGRETARATSANAKSSAPRWSHTIRNIAAQTAGAVAGALLAVTLFGEVCRRSINANLPRRPLGRGTPIVLAMFTEFTLSAALNTLVLLSEPGTKAGGRRLLSPYVPLLATFVWFEWGTHSGPSLNPALAAGWQVALAGREGVPLHSAVEHVCLFWVMPLCGGFFGGTIVRVYKAMALRGVSVSMAQRKSD